jgi:hypothetical protein
MELSSEMLDEYYRLVNALDRREWLDVKRKLCGEDSAKVMKLLKTYVTAWMASQKANKLLDKCTGYGGHDTSLLADCWWGTRGLHKWRYAMRRHRAAFYDLRACAAGDALSVALYGTSSVYGKAEDTDEDEDTEDEDTDE